MAIARTTPKCPFCGKPVAKAVYETHSDLPWMLRPIGDNFIRWEMKECNCKKAKAERARIRKEQKKFWKDFGGGKTLKEILESKPQAKLRK